jgi:hypothetical protein
MRLLHLVEALHHGSLRHLAAPRVQVGLRCRRALIGLHQAVGAPEVAAQVSRLLLPLRHLGA